MPYVKEHLREILTPEVSAPITEPGELNYAITQLCLQYVAENGLSYSTINDILGACTGARDEFYRRVAAPYEDKKIAENGDVYPDSMTGQA